MLPLNMSTTVLLASAIASIRSFWLAIFCNNSSCLVFCRWCEYMLCQHWMHSLWIVALILCHIRSLGDHWSEKVQALNCILWCLCPRCFCLVLHYFVLVQLDLDLRHLTDLLQNICPSHVRRSTIMLFGCVSCPGIGCVAFYNCSVNIIDYWSEELWL